MERSFVLDRILPVLESTLIELSEIESSQEITDSVPLLNSLDSSFQFFSLNIISLTTSLTI